MSILKANRIENLTTTDGGINVDNSGRVLIGTTNAGSNGTADDLIVANDGSASDQAGITIRGGTSGRSQIFFSDGTSGDAEYRGMLRYDHSEDSMQFRTAASERLRIDSSGNVGIGTSSPVSIFDVIVGASGQRRFVVNYDDSIITIKGSNAASNPETFRVIGDNIRFNTGTSGSGTERMRLTNNGLTFNGDTAASNALDDYEEGTFTPTLTGATHYSTQSGSYRKVGNLVHFNVFIGVSATPSSTSMIVSGLPYTSRSGNEGYGGFGRCWTNTWSSNGNNVQWLMNPNSNSLYAYVIPSSGGVTQINSNNMGANGNFIVTGAYHVA